MDIPVDQCPWEIGVICFQLSIMPDKNQTKEKEEPAAVLEVKQAMAKVAAVVEIEPMKEAQMVPEGTEDMFPLKLIKVPEGFLKTRPNPQKTQAVIDYVKQHGHLDELIIIDKKMKMLQDGNRRYLVPQTLNLEIVPVKYK